METPLSKDQQVRKLEEGWLEITATVVDSLMLEQWMKGFGDKVKEIQKEFLN